MRSYAIMQGIFISYRRNDSMPITRRIYDRLAVAFGEDQVFRDVDSIKLGVNFRDHIAQVLLECDILLAVVGRNWLRDGNVERLQHAEDYVHLEIATALDRQIHLIPVLVDGASMPQKQGLPGKLARLVFCKPIILTDNRFDQELEGLIGQLQKLPPSGIQKESEMQQLVSQAQQIKGLHAGLQNNWGTCERDPDLPPDEETAYELNEHEFSSCENEYVKLALAFHRKHGEFYDPMGSSATIEKQHRANTQMESDTGPSALDVLNKAVKIASVEYSWDGDWIPRDQVDEEITKIAKACHALGASRQSESLPILEKLMELTAYVRRFDVGEDHYYLTDVGEPVRNAAAQALLEHLRQSFRTVSHRP